MINNVIDNIKVFFNLLKREYLLLILIFVICLSFFYPIKKAYNKQFEIENYTDKFENSQYMRVIKHYENKLSKSAYGSSQNSSELKKHKSELGKLFDYMPEFNISNSTVIMKDPDLYAYRSYFYIHGIIHPLIATPIIQHGNLPSIFMGLSILIFKTPYVASIPVGLACLLLIFFLSQSVFKNRNLSFIVVGFFCTDILFRFFQLRTTILDSYQCLFILLSFYFLFKIIDDNRKHRKNYILLTLSLGGAVSVKPMVGVLLILVIFIYLFCINSIQNFKRVLKYLPLSFFIYLIIEWPRWVFLKRFILFYKFIPFKIISNILVFKPFVGQITSNTCASGYSFEIFRMLFTGKWKSISTGNIEKIYSFFPLIIFFSLASFLSIYYILRRRKRKKEIKLFVLYLWLIIYCFTLSFKTIFPWYLIEILPFVYILGCYTCYNIIKSLRLRIIR